MGNGWHPLGFLASKIHQLVAPSRAWESSDSWSWHGRSTGAKEAGNYGDPFGVQRYTDEMRMKEFNNGRMVGDFVLCWLQGSWDQQWKDWYVCCNQTDVCRSVHYVLAGRDLSLLILWNIGCNCHSSRSTIAFRYCMRAHMSLAGLDTLAHALRRRHAFWPLQRFEVTDDLHPGASNIFSFVVKIKIMLALCPRSDWCSVLLHDLAISDYLLLRAVLIWRRHFCVSFWFVSCLCSCFSMRSTQTGSAHWLNAPCSGVKSHPSCGVEGRRTTTVAWLWSRCLGFSPQNVLQAKMRWNSSVFELLEVLVLPFPVRCCITLCHAELRVEPPEQAYLQLKPASKFKPLTWHCVTRSCARKYHWRPVRSQDFWAPQLWRHTQYKHQRDCIYFICTAFRSNKSSCQQLTFINAVQLGETKAKCQLRTWFLCAIVFLCP